jgi:uncharacterized alkaline shock family protein YloU
MGEAELFISGMGISKEVIATIVKIAAEGVEGVVRVGGNDIASNLVSVFTRRTVPSEASVEAEVVDGDLKITVHLAVFYGYPFTKLAATVRTAIATAIAEQVGVEVGSVDVCIDSLVFPKEQ